MHRFGKTSVCAAGWPPSCGQRAPKLSKLHASPAPLQVHAIAQYIPPELLAQAETEWRQQSSVIKVSLTHRWAHRV